MKLTTARVTNFRSVEDSGDFTLGQVLCLVGKNEAGKTAIVHAIAGLNPHPSTPITYNKERDYPRRHLTEYAARHGESEATVITTKWSITDSEKKQIAGIVGDAAITGNEITISRAYEDKEASWEFPISYQKAVEFLLNDARLDEQERAPLKDATTTDDLRKRLQAMSQRTTEQQNLLTRIEGFQSQNVRGALTALFRAKLPRFMYFSHYDRMDGQIRLDTFAARKAGQAQPPVETGERVFVDFLEYAGTTVNEISTATTYEALNAKCEAASNSITAQLLEYWTQNPDLEIEVRVTKAEPNDAPPSTKA